MPAKVCTSQSFEATAEDQLGATDAPMHANNPQRLLVFKNPSSARRKTEKASASEWSLSRTKRLFDIAVAFPALVVFAVPMLLIAICIRLTSKGPAIFIQQRVGRNGHLFSIYKFRSMTSSQGRNESLGLTKEDDCRTTALGRWLRKLKLDELPQLYNVLRGDLSLVGPRPKLPQYESFHNMPYRPGITGASTLAFLNEEKILSRIPPEKMEMFYNLRIKPLKARMDSRYMKRATFWTDLTMIGATLLSCVITRRSLSGFSITFRPVTTLERRTYYEYNYESFLSREEEMAP